MSRDCFILGLSLGEEQEGFSVPRLVLGETLDFWGGLKPTSLTTNTLSHPGLLSALEILEQMRGEKVNNAYK